MKIIHCADLHLDARMTSNLTREQAKERKNEILHTFVHMVDYAVGNGVRAILIAGDMFDTRNVSATVRNVVKNLIVENPQIDFLYLRGNHDNDNFLSKLEEVPENLKLFGDRWISYNYGKVHIQGVELNGENQAYAYNSLVLKPDCFNIVTLHGQIGEYKSRNRAEDINLEHLRNKNIDYLALGHVHHFVCDSLDNRGTYCYSGCMEGRGFDECGEKGFVLLNVDETSLTATMQFERIASRTLFTMSVDVTGVMTTNEAAQRIEKEINRTHYSARSLVKILLTGQVDVECEMNLDYLEDMFSEYYYYLKVADNTKILVKYSDYEKDQSLKGEFVRMVMASDLEEEEKYSVIRCGIQALSGEEI